MTKLRALDAAIAWGNAGRIMNAQDGAAGRRCDGQIADVRSRIERRLSELTPGGPAPRRLADAMRYSLLAPAKRVRGILAVLCALHCGGTIEQVLPAACALEMVHAASLILDDLPAMDDAQQRRGQDVCHRVHGEATAMLAAVSLMNRAFAVVVEVGELGSDCRLAVVGILSRAIGTDGLTGGQEGDLHGAGLGGTAEVEWIHARKTGVLFAAATEIGALVAGGVERQEAMRDFGMQLGLAFQAYDDLLDARAASTAIGKDTSADARKATLVSLLGFETALLRAEMQMSVARRLCPDLCRAESGLGAYLAGIEAHMRLPLGLAVRP